MIEHLKILSHPAVWAIFATEIIGWNCYFRLMVVSTSSAELSLCPSYCQSNCSGIYNGYPGSTSLRATYHHTPALSLGFFSVSAAGQYRGELRVGRGSPNVTSVTYLLLRAYYVNTYCICLQDHCSNYLEPEVACTMEYIPQSGSDGIMYFNNCLFCSAFLYAWQ